MFINKKGRKQNDYQNISFLIVPLQLKERSGCREGREVDISKETVIHVWCLCTAASVAVKMQKGF